MTLPALPLRWDRLTASEIGAALAAGVDTAVLPVGAIEQHGPHLATGTDAISAEAIALATAARLPVLVLPTIPYGCSLGHTDKWPGTLSLHPITLTQVVVEIARWAVSSGLTKIMFLSGHATNGPSLGSAILHLRHELPEARFRTLDIWGISPRALALYTRDAADFHANRGETSLLLHLAPEMVRMDQAFDVPDVTPGTEWQYPMPRTTPTGVVGNPTEATAADGAMMVDILVEDFAALLTRAVAEPWPVIPAGPQDA
ncbi:creatininase family protein [Acidisoma cellulosilytica]|uniref:Creatininase family protein n=1 Tax=Acidisoma cellulosilyticum TaxID=2802395 RepID=A0A963Z7N3_9PROT|nr:creatininase family protein [Acidisoma cellulosilyticum]MCB8883377.1 creatininase family protein [Acidisoma cellulosilyticum]